MMSDATRFRSLLSLIEQAAVPHRSRRIIQYRNMGFEPPVQTTEKHPQSFHRIRQHQPRQIILCERATNNNMQTLFNPLIPGRRDGSVAVRRDDVSDDLILGYGDELEKRRIEHREAVFAEDERGGGARDAHLVGIYWVVVEAFFLEGRSECVGIRCVDWMGGGCPYFLVKNDALILVKDGSPTGVWRRGTLSGLWALGRSELFAKVVPINPESMKIAPVRIFMKVSSKN